MAEPIKALLAQANAYREAIDSARQHYVYNLGSSGRAGAEALMRLTELDRW